MPAVPVPSFLCPACQTPLPPVVAEAGALRCPACDVEVDAARLETLVGKPRFVAERSWTGVELPGMVVEDVIGAGGMGTVYRARATRDGEGPLAVKFLSPSLAGEADLVARFWREVALLETLDHPGIVKVKAHGEHEGLPWFAMDLVEGPTLAMRLAKGPLEVEDAAAIFTRLLDALTHAHERGVVHRDLKPANVLLAKDGARLADFGIARLDMAAATRKTQLTRTDAIIGTFSYMSPEQRAGRTVDVRSDLYSIGVMLYETLAGERPEGAFPPLSRRRPEVPAKIDPVVRRLLQPDPPARFASAAATRRALVAAFAARGLTRRPLLWASAAAVVLAAAIGIAGSGRTPSEKEGAIAPPTKQGKSVSTPVVKQPAPRVEQQTQQQGEQQLNVAPPTPDTATNVLDTTPEPKERRKESIAKPKVPVSSKGRRGIKTSSAKTKVIGDLKKKKPAPLSSPDRGFDEKQETAQVQTGSRSLLPSTQAQGLGNKSGEKSRLPRRSAARSKKGGDMGDPLDVGKSMK